MDYQGNVWIGGNGNGNGKGSSGPVVDKVDGHVDPGAYHDSMILKFTQAGKFLMQIGKAGESKGSNDVVNLR